MSTFYFCLSAKMYALAANARYIHLPRERIDHNRPCFFDLAESNDSFIAKPSESESNRCKLDSGDTVHISFNQSTSLSYASSHPPSPIALIASQDAQQFDMQHTSSVSQNDITLLEQYHKIWSSFDQQEAENITQHPIPNGKHQPPAAYQALH